MPSFHGQCTPCIISKIVHSFFLPVAPLLSDRPFAPSEARSNCLHRLLFFVFLCFCFLFHSFLFFSPFACVRVFNGPCSYRSRHLRGFHATISVTDWLDTLHPQEETAMALPGGYILWAWVGLSLQFPLPSLLTCQNEDDMIDNMPVWHRSPMVL